MRHVLSVKVENKPGVLQRVTGLISRRGFNIESLSVGPTQDPAWSCVVAVVEADNISYEQITKQLNKLVCVLTVTDLTKKDPLEHELVMFKINAEPDKLAEITQLISLFNASIIDVGSKRLAIEAVGDPSTLERLTSLLDAYGIVEMVRSGRVATARNAV